LAAAGSFGRQRLNELSCTATVAWSRVSELQRQVPIAGENYLGAYEGGSLHGSFDGSWSSAGPNGWSKRLSPFATDGVFEFWPFPAAYSGGISISIGGDELLLRSFLRWSFSCLLLLGTKDATFNHWWQVILVGPTGGSLWRFSYRKVPLGHRCAENWTTVRPHNRPTGTPCRNFSAMSPFGYKLRALSGGSIIMTLKHVFGRAQRMRLPSQVCPIQLE
jgi:hypothetical protein